MTLLEQIFWLTALHFVADFRLQSDFMARNKVQGSSSIWPWVLSAHCATHAAAVGLILSPLLGALEFVSHAATDYLKGRGLFGNGGVAFHIDQIVHILTKFVWLALYWLAPGIFA